MRKTTLTIVAFLAFWGSAYAIPDMRVFIDKGSVNAVIADRAVSGTITSGAFPDGDLIVNAAMNGHIVFSDITSGKAITDPAAWRDGDPAGNSAELIANLGSELSLPIYHQKLDPNGQIRGGNEKYSNLLDSRSDDGRWEIDHHHDHHHHHDHYGDGDGGGCNPGVTPEPGTLVLLGSGLLVAFGAYSRRK